MDINRVRYKQVSSKFRSTDDSRALRAITQEDDRRARRRDVVRIHRNIPETLSPEPSPSISGVRTTKKAFAAAAAIAKAKATIQKLSEDSNASDMQTASPMHAAHRRINQTNTPVLRKSPGVKNSQSAATSKATKPSKLIEGKTLEELRSERMERLKLYKKLKQKKQERERATKKPCFWLGVSKKEPKVLLLPPSKTDSEGGQKLATPHKAQAPVWHSGFSSISKKQASNSLTATSTNKARGSKSSRNLFTDSTRMGASSSRAVVKQLSAAAGRTGASATAIPGSEKFHVAKRISFAPKDYKFSAPSGLQRVSARGPTPRRPSIRFSRTPPPMTPPTSGPRRMPRTKTPKPSTSRSGSPKISGDKQSSSSDELPAESPSRVVETTHRGVSQNELSNRNSSGSMGNRQSGDVKLSRRLPKKRSTQLTGNKEVSFETASPLCDQGMVDQNSQELPEEERSAQQCDEKLLPKRKAKRREKESLTCSEEEEVSDSVGVTFEGSVTVTPPNTELSFAVLADSIKKKSRERSISKVSRSSSIKKSNLISKLNLSADEGNDESSDVQSPSVNEPRVYASAKESPSVKRTPLAANLTELCVQQRSATSFVSEENKLNLNSNKALLSTSSSCLSPSPVSSLFGAHSAHDPVPSPLTNSSIKEARHSRSSGHKSSDGKRRSVESTARLTAPMPDVCGCSPELQVRSKKRKSLVKIVSPVNAEAGDSSCAPFTPAPSSARKRQSVSVRRSARIATATSSAGESDGGLRTPSNASQRTTAVTPCSRSTRRSLAVHAASTWEEFCATTPQLPAPGKTPRRRRKTVAHCDSVPPITEKLSPQPENCVLKTPGRRGRRKTVISEAQNDVVTESHDLRTLEKDASQSDGGVSGTGDATVAAADAVHQQCVISLDEGDVIPRHSPPRSGNKERKRNSKSSSVTPVNINNTSAQRSSERSRKIISATPAVSVFSASSGPSPSLSASSSCPDVSELLDRSPFVNIESRALKRKKLAQKNASFMDDACEDVRPSFRSGGEEKEEEETAATPGDITNGDMAELIRATTPCSPADVSINVWDEISSPVLDTDGRSEAEPGKQGSGNQVDDESKENQDPASELSSGKRRSLKPKRRSSLRRSLLGTHKSRTESALHSRVSLGLFAKNAPESPVVSADVAEGDDLISWESPKTVPQKQNGVTDRSSLASPRPRSGGVRGKRVSRLAALYEQTLTSPTPSATDGGGGDDDSGNPTSVTRRSIRLRHQAAEAPSSPLV